MTTTSHAIIIGGSRGIGAGIVGRLSGLGWNVTATRRGSGAAGGPDNVHWIEMDINIPADRKALYQQLSSTEFDLIFINAGVFGPDEQNIMTADDDELVQLFMTNAFSPARCIHELLPLLKKDKGIMGVMTSELASLNENASAVYPLYAASKAALNMLTREAEKQIRQNGQTLLSVHPGWVKTDMGGDAAPLSVADSAAGIVSQFEKWRGKAGHFYIDYQGRELQW